MADTPEQQVLKGIDRELTATARLIQDPRRLHLRADLGAALCIIGVDREHAPGFTVLP